MNWASNKDFRTYSYMQNHIDDFNIVNIKYSVFVYFAEHVEDRFGYRRLIVFFALKQLMYKTAFHTLVNGSITDQKQQISEKGDIMQNYIA